MQQQTVSEMVKEQKIIEKKITEQKKNWKGNPFKNWKKKNLIYKWKETPVKTKMNSNQKLERNSRNITELRNLRNVLKSCL